VTKRASYVRLFLVYIYFYCRICFMPEKIENRGGAFLKARRESLGLSLRQAGELAQPPMSASHLSQIENGKVRGFNINFLSQVGQSYRLSVPEVLIAFGVEVDGPNWEDFAAMRLGKMVMELPEPLCGSVSGFIQDLSQKYAAPSA